MRSISFPIHPKEIQLKSVFLRNPVSSVSSVIVRKSLIDELGGFSEEYPGASDYDFWMRAAERSCLGYLDQPLLNYHVHPQSYSWVRADQMLEDIVKILETAASRNSFLKPLLNKRLGAVFQSFSLLSFERKDGLKSFRYLFKAIQTTPGDIKKYLLLTLLLSGGLGRRFLLNFRRRHQFRNAE
jgi:hypothetical protein